MPPKITNLIRGKALFLGTYVSCKPAPRWPNFKNVSNSTANTQKPFANWPRRTDGRFGGFSKQGTRARAVFFRPRSRVVLLPIPVLLGQEKGDPWARAALQNNLVYTNSFWSATPTARLKRKTSRIRGQEAHWLGRLPTFGRGGGVAPSPTTSTGAPKNSISKRHCPATPRRTANRVYMQAPLDKIKRKLFQRGIISVGGNQSKALNALKNNSHDQIIQYYNSIITNLLKYYSFVDNWNSLKQQLKL